MNTWFWEKLLPKGSGQPTSREGHTFHYNNKISKWILFGGVSSGRTSETLSLDTSTGLWDGLSKSPPPPERAYHTSWLDNEGQKLYIFGGQGGKREPLYDMHALCLKTGKWIKLGPSERPSGRIYSAGCLVKDHLYMFGGASAPSDMLNNDLWCLPFKEINWPLAEKEGNCPGWIELQTNYSPRQRKGHSMVNYDGTIYIFGGFYGTGYLNDLCCISPTNLQYSYPHIFGASPSPRAYHSCTITSNAKMIIFGGKGKASKNHNEILCDVFILDLIDLYWSSPFIAGFYPAPRYGAGMAWGLNINRSEQILIIGGIGKSYVGMDVFNLTEKEIDSSTQWYLEDVQSGKLKYQAVTETTLLSNRRKIRDLEGQNYNLQEKCEILDDEIYTLKGKLEEAEHEKNEMSSTYIKITQNLNSEIKRNEKSIAHGIKYLHLKNQKNKLFEEKIARLSSILKDTESFLVMMDSAFFGMISSNLQEEFRTFSQDRMNEIAERKKNHHFALASLRDWFKQSLDEEASFSVDN